MTAICAVRNKDGIWMGGDRAASNCWGNTEVVAHPKVFKNGHMLIGFAGDFRAAQLIEHVFTPPKITKNQDAMTWCVTQFVPALQECLCENDYDGEEESFGILFSVHNRLFTMTTNYAIMEYEKDWAAIGEGEQFCDGVLSVLGTDNPEQTIEMALSAAERNCGGVTRPFDIVKD